MGLKIKLDDEAIREISKDITHCGNIASSAITLATERSVDIDVPLMVTYIMLKKLCEENIKYRMSIDVVPKEAARIADEIGMDVNSIRNEAIEGLEAMIDDYFEWAMAKREFDA